MVNLYKGRYLIAIYDKYDNFIDCGISVRELRLLKHSSVYSQISRNEFFNSEKCYKVVLIDCLEKHNDIFAEEDEIFLKSELCYSSKTDLYNKLMEKYDKSLRTIQRWCSIGKINLDKEIEKGV